MSQNGPSAGLVPNGTGSHLSHRPQTPAYTVGNQFVHQFYSVLSHQPEFLYRFYTDQSTVTHSDSGFEERPPSSVTVTTQKDIRDRMAIMEFHEASVEIWSVESQYSCNHGVTVMVTGTIECKGKKQRPFVQSFFLATQEKGYFVLNDIFRYLADRQMHPPIGEKAASALNNQGIQASSAYHQAQPAPGQLYYPGVQPPQQQPQPHPAYSQSYQAVSQPSANHTANHQQQVRHATVTPAPAQNQFPTQPKEAPEASSAPSAPATQDAPAPAESKPVTNPTPQPSGEPAKAAKPDPAPAKPKQSAVPPASLRKQEEDAPKSAAQPAPEAPKPAEKEKETKSVATQSTQTAAPPAPKPAAEPQKAVERPPSGPLTYADRLRMNANASANQTQKPANQAPRTAPVTPQRPTTSPGTSSPAVRPPETSADNSETTERTNSNKFNSSAKEEDVVTKSVFVKNLPEDITAAKLAEVFSQYGKIKGGVQGVSLRQQKGKPDFAFVDFEEQSAMQAAVSAKSVLIDEKPVTVVERKPYLPKDARSFGGRGGRGEGRGDGRGSFRGGRGDGRGRGRDNREGRPHTTGGRPEGRPEGRGRGYEGRGSEGGRGRGGDRGRGRYSGGRQGAPATATAAAQPISA